MISSRPIDIEDAHADVIEHALKTHLPTGVRVYAFGSRVGWQAKHASDLDLAMDAGDIHRKAINALEEELNESDLPYKVDIVNLNTISESFYNAISGELVEILWEWRECKLDDFAKINPTGRLPKGSFAKKIPMEALKPFTKKIPLYLNEKYNGGVKFRNGDTVMARITPSLENGKTSYVDVLNNDEIGFGSTEFIVLREREDISNKHFLYYLVISSEIRNIAILSMTGSSGRQRVQTNVVKEHELFVPPLSEQKAIAEVLSSLDDKIDLLHRQNKTLEQMAETLFRQWFVEEAGEDWEEKPLSSIANFLNGLACQKFPPKNDVDKLPVLKIKQLRNGFSDDSDWCMTEVEPEYIISDGDVIFSWSASLMVKIWDGEKCILNQHLFKVSSDEFPKWFYYLWSKHHLDEFVSISSSHATTMGHIKRGDLDDAMVLVPSSEEIHELSEAFTPLIDKIISNNKRLKNLVSLRDALLPKLMSGEVRIANYG